VDEEHKSNSIREGTERDSGGIIPTKSQVQIINEVAIVLLGLIMRERFDYMATVKSHPKTQVWKAVIVICKTFQIDFPVEIRYVSVP